MQSRFTTHLFTTILLATLASLCPPASAESKEFLTARARAADFAAFCRFVADEYAYFDIKATDWNRACKHYAAQARAAKDATGFLHALEGALQQLYDAHAHLGTNAASSLRLVPSQSDTVAVWRDGKAIITDVRAGSSAEHAGLEPDDEILAINDKPVAAAAAQYEPRFLTHSDPAALDWALQAALAGRHDEKSMRIRVSSPQGTREVTYTPVFPRSRELLTTTITDRIAHFRINNSLGEQSLVREFDQALENAADARAIVIDLRDTPSGGTSSVARGILGRLVDTERPYQRHELVGEYRSTGIRRTWVEYVTPRGATFNGPVLVLVGPWTGSMGEGLAIGLNAARGAPVLGRPMAHLRGALGETTLPNSHIVVRVPVEKLFHVDGTPREGFLPCPVAQPNARSNAEDHELRAAFELVAGPMQLPPASNDCR